MSFRHNPADSLADIVENVETIGVYLGGMTITDFTANRLVRDAVERCLERVCEAVFRLRDNAETLLPGQPVRDIRGFGNHLRHAYDGLDLKVLWHAATYQAPALAADARRALTKLEPDSQA
jgi:uncharacterized protein with HEPN domain